MRLGDLDALRDEISSWGCNDYDKYDFIEAIDNAPTYNPVGHIMATAEGFCTNPAWNKDDPLEDDAKQASIPYTYNAPQHDWKCGYPDITGGKEE